VSQRTEPLLMRVAIRGDNSVGIWGPELHYSGVHVHEGRCTARSLAPCVHTNFGMPLACFPQSIALLVLLARNHETVDEQPGRSVDPLAIVELLLVKSSKADCRLDPHVSETAAIPIVLAKALVGIP